MTEQVESILANYRSENPGVQGKLAQLLMQGRLGGTGKMIVLPVDQGIEHGPARSFAVNPAGYDPVYHHELAIDAGLTAYAAPLGALEASSPRFPAPSAAVPHSGASSGWASTPAIPSARSAHSGISLRSRKCA